MSRASNERARAEIAWTYEYERGAGFADEVARKRSAAVARAVRRPAPPPKPPAPDPRACVRGRVHTGCCNCDSDG